MADTAQAAPAPPVAAPPANAPPSAKLDDVMMAMDVVDTLRHREVLVERELNEEQRERALIERLRSLYKSQGIEVSDAVLAQGVKALAESRFVYTPAPPSLGRTLATLWVKRRTAGLGIAVALAVIVGAVGFYQFTVVRPQQQAAEAARIELTQTLPRALNVAHQAVMAEAQVEEARARSASLLAQGQAALARNNAAEARTTLGEIDALLAALRQEYVLRIAGRPEDQTGFFRETRMRGRIFYLVVNAVDTRGQAVQLPVRNGETNAVQTVSRFAVAVPEQTFDRVRADKARNTIVQNDRLAEKRRGFLEPDFRMPVLEGRLTPPW
jgi:hypothetical protein